MTQTGVTEGLKDEDMKEIKSVKLQRLLYHQFYVEINVTNFLLVYKQLTF